MPPSYAFEFEKANISYFRGAVWYATAHHWKEAIRIHNNWISECDHRAKDQIMLMREKDGIDGDCYWISSNVLQWISSSENLITSSGEFSDKVYYLEYPDKNAPENGVYGVVKRSGSVTYRNSLGKTIVTPKFIVVALIDGK